MADTVTSQTLYDHTAGYGSGGRAAFKFTNLSDGTGETGVTKINVSSLNGAASPVSNSRVKIKRIMWSVQSNGSVTVGWGDTSSPVPGLTPIFILSGNGDWKFDTGLSPVENNANSPTGDVVFSTNSFSNNDSYTIIIEVVKDGTTFTPADGGHPS